MPGAAFVIGFVKEKRPFCYFASGARRVEFRPRLDEFFPMQASEFNCSHRKGLCGSSVRIPAMPITNSNLMAIRIPIDADHHRSEATLDCTYHR